MTSQYTEEAHTLAPENRRPWRTGWLMGLGGVGLLAAGILLGRGPLAPHSDSLRTTVSANGSILNFKITDTHPDASGETSLTDTLLAGSVDCATYDSNVDGSVRLTVYPKGTNPANIESFKEDVGDGCSGTVPSGIASWAITVAWGSTDMAGEAYTG